MHASGSFVANGSARAARARGIVPLACMLLLGGCVTAPHPLQGTFAAVDPSAALARDATGERVRWGGTIADVEPLADQTCFQLVARRLGADARPLAGDRPEGRFIACRTGFYEPAIFRTGRSVTVTGHVTGYATRTVGQHDVREPTVAADVIYLWPLRRDVGIIGPPWY